LGKDVVMENLQSSNIAAATITRNNIFMDIFPG
jgi:hypothetical protein